MGMDVGASIIAVVEKPSRVVRPAAAAPKAGFEAMVPLAPVRRRSMGSGAWPEAASTSGTDAVVAAIWNVAMLATSACGKAGSIAADGATVGSGAAAHGAGRAPPAPGTQGVQAPETLAHG